MKRFIPSVFFAVALLLVSVASAAVDIVSITSPAGNPGGSVNVQVNVANTASAGSITVAFTSSALTGPGGSITAPSVPNIVVPAGSSASRTFAVNIPSLLAGVYSGALEVKDLSDASNTDQASYSVTINPVSSFDVTDRDVSSNKMVVTSNEGNRITGTFKIKNTGSEPITDLALSFNQNDFKDSDGDQIVISHNLPAVLQPGVEATVTLTIDPNDKVDINTYDGTVTVAGAAKSDTFTLEIRVQPEVCSDGNVGDLNIDLREPDSGDDFKPGQRIPIEVKVDNDGNDDLDVTVTAFLFDVDDGDNIEEVDSDEINIDEDDSETFEFELAIPEDADESHSFKLFIKSHEDGNEDEQCDETSVDLDIKRERNDVITKSIKLTPAIVNAGSSIEIVVTAQNIGSRDQDDVVVTLSNPELGLELQSNSFSLEKFDDDDTQVERFTFSVPEDAETGSYDIEATVAFGSKTSSAFAPLRVEAKPVPPRPSAVLDTAEAPASVDQGKLFDLPVKVSNTGLVAETFTVQLVAGSWAGTLQPQTITLGPGKSSTVFFTVQPSESAAGSQSLSVELLSNGNILDSKRLSINLRQPQAPPSGVSTGLGLGGLFSGTTLWILADIVLVILAIVFIRLLFRSKRRD